MKFLHVNKKHAFHANGINQQLKRLGFDNVYCLEDYPHTSQRQTP